MLAGSLALAGGALGTGIGASQLIMSYGGQTTAEQDTQTNRATGIAMGITSPVGLPAGMAGLVATGSEEGLERGAFIGNITEGGVAFAYGVGTMALRELHFQHLKKLLGVTGSNWEEVRPLIQEVYGLADPASRLRSNPLFWKHVERVELSHFVARRDLKGYEWLGNRPGNVTPVWATEHALVDPSRFQFMTKHFKAVYGGQQLQGLERFLHLAPPWMVQSGYGIAVGASAGLRQGLRAAPTGPEVISSLDFGVTVPPQKP